MPGNNVRVLQLVKYVFYVVIQSFMFESSYSLQLTEWGNKTCLVVDDDYHKCWEDLTSNFDPNWKPPEGDSKQR